MNAFELMRAGPKSATASASNNTTKKTGTRDENIELGSSQLPAALPWIEKYRPKSIGSVSGQESTTKVLAKALNRADLPHMLFYGPPGTGKTSTILALARELFGHVFSLASPEKLTPELMKSRVLELNASDERGISIVREKIKSFAKVTVSPASSKYPCPAFKIIILDEADSMTQDAQSALRRIMENYSKITRFCLICNYVTRIIEPIVSRCSKFRFKPLSQVDTKSKLQEISKLESIKISESSLSSLIKISNGDLRRSITFLQSLSKFTKIDQGKEEEEEEEEEIKCSDVEEIGGVIPSKEMNRLLSVLGIESDSLVIDQDGDLEMSDVTITKKTLKKSTSFELIDSTVEDILLKGYSAVQLLNQLHDSILLNPLIPTKPKTTIALEIGETDKRLNDGAHEGLQILSLCLKIHKSIITN